MKERPIFFFVIPFGLLLFAMCSSNPIFKDKDSSSQRIVKGKVRLSDNSDPGDVFVWFEGLNASTVTDEAGEFTLQIPPPQFQPGRGMSGDFRLFYYIANYEYAISSVVIRDGYIEYGTGDVDSEGNMNDIIVLTKLLDIKTEISPSEIIKTDALRLTVSVSVTLVPDSPPIVVQTYKTPDDNWLTRMIFREINNPIDNAVLHTAGGILVTEYISNPIQPWHMGINTHWISPRLEPGVYDVIPYLRIVQEGLPEELIKSIGENADAFHHDYLRIPFKWAIGRLKVLG